MRLCFTVTLAVGTLVGLYGAEPEPGQRVTSVVRSDPRSGRLVRSVLVSPRTVPSRVISPEGESKKPEGEAKELKLAPDASINEMVEETARQYDVDPLLVHSVIQVESNYNPNATSPKGAQGLMQLIPSTARRFGVKNSYSARENIEGGVRYLKYLQTLYNNDLRLALAAYNAGEGAVARYNWIPPYPETQNYVYEVGKRYGQARRTVEARKAQAKPESASAPSEPQPRPVEQVVDAEGRISLRTK